MASSTILSTHGMGAIQSSDLMFSKIFDDGRAVVTVPSTAAKKIGWLNFTIPSPTPGVTFLKEASVNYTVEGGASVTGIQVYQGDSQLLSILHTVKSNTTLPLNSPQEYDGNGILVSIRVEFTSAPAAKLSILSVGVVAYSS